MKKHKLITVISFISIYIFSDPTATEVTSLVGTLHKYPPMSQFDYYFETDSNDIYGIQLNEKFSESEQKKFRNLIMTNSRIVLDGILEENVIGPNGKNLIIDRYEIILENTKAYENISSDALVESDTYFSEKLNGKTIAYLPENINDGYLGSCWVEGRDSYGIGEKIIFKFPNKVSVDKMKIDIGFDRSEELFYSNSRIKKLKITLGDVQSFIYSFIDKRGLQEIVFSQYYDIDTILFEILDVFPGSKYSDTCISEIEIWGFYSN